MDAKSEIASMLARQVLGFEDPRDPRPHSGWNDPRLATAQVQVDLRLESMVRGIVRQVWVDSAAVASVVEDRVREAISDANIEKVITEVANREVALARDRITRMVQDKIARLVESGVDAALGDGPRKLANKIASRMWDRVFGDVAKRGGTSPRPYSRRKR